MFTYLVLVLALVNTTKCFENGTYNVLEKLTSGLKLAGKLLASDHASGVANLVSEAFEKTHAKKHNTEQQNNAFSGFLRILGFDSKKIGAITVNAIVFVAQLISSSTAPKTPFKNSESRKATDESIFEWLMNNETVADIVSNVKDENLSEKVIEYIKERTLDEDTGCIQLLICKSAPFIRHMQKSIDERGNGSPRGYNAMFAYLPNVDEVADNGDNCEEKYPFCSVHL